MTKLWQLSAVEQAAGIRDGRFTATALVESSLARVAEKNAELNAIVDPLSEHWRRLNQLPPHQRMVKRLGRCMVCR